MFAAMGDCGVSLLFPLASPPLLSSPAEAVLPRGRAARAIKAGSRKSINVIRGADAGADIRNPGARRLEGATSAKNPGWLTWARGFCGQRLVWWYLPRTRLTCGTRSAFASTKPSHYANDHKPRARGLEDIQHERLPRSAFSADVHPIIYLAEG